MKVVISGGFTRRRRFLYLGSGALKAGEGISAAPVGVTFVTPVLIIGVTRARTVDMGKRCHKCHTGSPFRGIGGSVHSVIST
jgi:hypothetical protein